jgi:hypothetical protein
VRLVAVWRLVIRRFVVGDEIVEAFLHARWGVAVRREGSHEIDEHWAQVGAKTAEHRGAFALPKEEGEDGHVGFRAIAITAGENEVIAAIVCALATARSNVIERYRGRGYATAAVGADGAMLLNEPTLGFRVGGAAGGGRRQLGGGGAASPASSGAFSWSRHNGGKIAAGRLGRLETRERIGQWTTDVMLAPR